MQDFAAQGVHHRGGDTPALPDSPKQGFSAREAPRPSRDRVSIRTMPSRGGWVMNLRWNPPRALLLTGASRTDSQPPGHGAAKRPERLADAARRSKGARHGARTGGRRRQDRGDSARGRSPPGTEARRFLHGRTTRGGKAGLPLTGESPARPQAAVMASSGKVVPPDSAGARRTPPCPIRPGAARPGPEASWALNASRVPGLRAYAKTTSQRSPAR